MSEEKLPRRQHVTQALFLTIAALILGTLVGLLTMGDLSTEHYSAPRASALFSECAECHRDVDREGEVEEASSSLEGAHCSRCHKEVYEGWVISRDDIGDGYLWSYGEGR